MNLPVPVSSEDYEPPEDVLFEQVWDPSVVAPSPKGVGAPKDLAELVKEFAGIVSHDKVRGMVACSKAEEGAYAVAPCNQPWSKYEGIVVLSGGVAGGAPCRSWW